jgi:hypothetical protein
MIKHLQLFMVLAFIAAMPLSAQSIQYADANDGCYQGTAQTLNISASDGGSPVRHIYIGINMNGGYPTRVSWNAASNRWEIRSDLNVALPYDYENLDSYSTFASYPNPPDLATGAWVKVDSFCKALTQFNGTGTQNALPVTFVSQEAKIEAQDVTLKWQTATEINTSHFVIEKQEGNTFKKVGEVEAAGNTIFARNYSFTLANQPYGQNTYRITSKDLNGASESFTPLTVMIELADRFALSEAYPNPFNPSTSFTIAVAMDQQVKIQVYDLAGKLVQTLFEGKMAGQTSYLISFNASGLPSGKYIVQVAGEMFSSTKTLTLLK